jgi:hypothetical protein
MFDDDFQPGPPQKDLGFWIGIATKSLVPVLLLLFAGIGVAKIHPDFRLPQSEMFVVLLVIALHVAWRISLDFTRGNRLAAAKAERFPFVFKRNGTFAVIWLVVAIIIGPTAWAMTEPFAQLVLWSITALLVLRALQLLRRTRMPITLGIDGIHDRLSGKETIPWQDIVEIQERGGRGGVVAYVLDLQPEGDRKRRLKISVGDLDATPDELLACIEHMRRRARGDLAFKTAH